MFTDYYYQTARMEDVRSNWFTLSTYSRFGEEKKQKGYSKNDNYIPFNMKNFLTDQNRKIFPVNQW